MAVVFQIAMIFLDIVTWAVIARAILSWFYPIGKDPWSKLLLDVTEPLLAPVRTVLSRIMPIPIDFSPIVVILLINLLQRLLMSAYYSAG
jgi:YggT family protein